MLTMLLLGLLAIWAALLAAYLPRLRADWREPVMVVPVLVIESDDWGPGPPRDAQRLRELAALLAGLHDEHGAHPVMTIGVVLSVPDRVTPVGAYRRVLLDAPPFAPIAAALCDGRDAGVFALQLHGMEHFWPPALQRAAAEDDAARRFLAAAGDLRHESLPPHLQARWIDASRLPSAPLDDTASARAAADEAACFDRIFGVPAAVAVPVTFTWTPAVEAAWAGAGVRVVVTPGTRYVGRDGNGRLVGDGSILRNGDRGGGDVTFVVRDVYFEPSLGHRAESALAEIAERHRLGRPALVEMHRFNFTEGSEAAARSVEELELLLRGALSRIPGLRFVSTEALADAIAAGDRRWIDRRFGARLRAFVLRAATVSRLRKLAWVTGLALPALAALALASAIAPVAARTRVHG